MSNGQCNSGMVWSCFYRVFCLRVFLFFSFFSLFQLTPCVQCSIVCCSFSSLLCRVTLDLFGNTFTHTIRATSQPFSFVHFIFFIFLFAVVAVSLGLSRMYIKLSSYMTTLYV